MRTIPVIVLICMMFTLIACDGELTDTPIKTGVDMVGQGDMPVDLAPDATTDLGKLPDEGCVPDDRFFARDVWATTLQTKCYSCHNPQGVAGVTELVLQNTAGRPDSMSLNAEVVKKVALMSANGESVLLQKPLGELGHAGGAVIQSGDAHYKRLQEFIERTKQPTTCDVTSESLFEGTEVETPYRTIRRFALLFAARLPTNAEIARVDQEGEAALAPLMQLMMDEPAFADRMAEGFNDVFLTDGKALHLAGLHVPNHPDILWFRDLPQDQQSEALGHTADGIKYAPRELIKYIITTNKPLTDIILADYTMVNPHAARAFSLFDTIAWNDPNDPSEFHPTKLTIVRKSVPQAYPHSGLLTDYSYLRRYPSTATNQARGRARAYMMQFLNTDILKFAPLTADPLAIEAQWENPIRDAPECSVCHIAVDSIAGLFLNYQSVGSRQPGPVPDDTFPAGFEISTSDPKTVPIKDRTWSGKLPQAREADALRWLAEQTVKDPRFSMAMVRHVYTIVMGRAPIDPPNGAPSLARDGAFRAYEAQQKALEQWRLSFIDNQYDTKKLVQDIATSRFFRARRATTQSPALDAIRYDLGTAQLLTPEHFHRKINAIFTVPFELFLHKTPLLSPRSLSVLYGGIDSNEVTQRLKTPNGAMGAIQYLAANVMSCEHVTREFASSASERILFQDVTMEMFKPADEPTIRATLVHLHERLLGERLKADDPEITASLQLFNAVLSKGQAAIQARETKATLSTACDTETFKDDPDYVIRAWAAVVNYLMQTFEFIYE